MEELTIQTKKCCTCGRELPLDQFSKCSNGKDGLQPRCRDCASEAQKASYLRRKGQDGETSTYGLGKYAAVALVKEPRSRKSFALEDHFKPNELMLALKSLGYRGKLTTTVTMEVDLAKVD